MSMVDGCVLVVCSRADGRFPRWADRAARRHDGCPGIIDVGTARWRRGLKTVDSPAA
jgi:hypothetical protein